MAGSQADAERCEKSTEGNYDDKVLLVVVKNEHKTTIIIGID